jgi:hypothetical protein
LALVTAACAGSGGRGYPSVAAPWGTGSFVAVFDLEKDVFDSFSFDGTIGGPVGGGEWEAATR